MYLSISVCLSVSKLGSCCVGVGYNVPLTAIWLKSQVGLKVLHELRLHVTDHRESKYFIRVAAARVTIVVIRPYPLQQFTRVRL